MHISDAAHSVVCGACLQRAAAPLAVKGRKSIFTLNSTADAEVLATFSSDGSPAAPRRSAPATAENPVPPPRRAEAAPWLRVALAQKPG
mgnify:CR=1 FL=1